MVRGEKLLDMVSDWVAAHRGRVGSSQEIYLMSHRAAAGERSLQERFFRYGIYYPIVLLRGQWVPRYLREFRHTQFLDPAQLRELQERKLAALLRAATQHVPYYNSRKEFAWRLSGGTAFEWLGLFPPVQKSVLIEAEEQLRHPGWSWMQSLKTTGGSTGQPVSILKSRDALARELAATWRAYEWAGVRIGDKQARLWGVPHGAKARVRARLIDFMGNRRRLSAFALDDDSLFEYVTKLQRFSPRYVYGYASMLDKLAGFCIDNSVQIPSIECAISTSEVLTADTRERIRKAFGCRTFNEYGCGELGSIAHECENGRLHIMAENMIVEVMNGENPCQPGESGELVVTELNNHSMPLIRYRTGDLGRIDESPCECGVRLPILAQVFGREYECLFNSRGKQFHPEFFLYILEDAKRAGMAIGGAQFVEVDAQKIVIRLLAASEPDIGLEEYFRNTLREKFDSSVDVSFEYVKRLQREKSGKMRVVAARHPR